MKKGDKVSVLDDAISGVVIDIKGQKVSIETTDGFEMEFTQDELIVIDGSISDRDLMRMDVPKVISEKQPKKKKVKKQTRIDRRKQPAMEVDLHIHQLVPRTKGLSNYEMLNIQVDEAKRQLEFAMSKRIQRVVFIHGIGEGVLRSELEFLFGRYDNLEYYDADYQKYGRGATEVYIYQNPAK